ncbi:MAG: addiction module protein [Balneolaceae bacterium]
MINEKIRKQALKLSSEERAELAHALIESLKNEQESLFSEEQKQELDKRLKSYESGEMEFESWNVVRERIINK